MPIDSAVLDKPSSRMPSIAAAFAAVPRWAILLVAAIAVRAIAFGNPVVHVDEEFYFVTAQQMLHGAIPYVDVWDRKPIGLFLLYLPAAAFGVPGGLWVYQMMALASVVATATLILRFADRAGGSRGALTAALLYLFMLGFGDGQGGQAPVFYNLLMAGAVMLVLPCPDADMAKRHRRGMGAMALIGVAMQIKYSVLFEGMFLGLWLLWREQRLAAPLTSTLRYAVAMVALAIAPTLVAGAVFYAIGHGDAWLYANFGSIFERNSDPTAVLRVAFLKVALILGPLLIVSGLSRRVPAESHRHERVRALYFGWLIASVFGLVVFGSWFNHYALPVMLPASLCCAGYLGSTRIGRKWVAPALLLAAGGGGEYTAWSAAWHRGNAQEVEALAGAIGHGPGCLYIYSGDTILYPYSRRCTVTPWLFPSHLSRTRENGAIGIDQRTEVARIMAGRPAIVMMRPAYQGERPEIRAFVKAELQRGGYASLGRYPLGDSMIEIYAAPTAEATAPRLAASKPS